MTGSVITMIPKRLSLYARVCALVLGLAVAFGLLELPVSAQQPNTIEVLGSWIRPGLKQAWEQIVADFNAANPGARVVLRVKAFNEIVKEALTALPAGKGPDVLAVNPGEGMMGPLVRAQALVPLDKYARQYDWNRRLATPSLLDTLRYGEGGTVYGAGSLYAAPSDGEVVAFYYNAQIFRKLGVNAPRSFIELEDLLRRLKDAGITPISFGNLDRWPAIHTYGALQHMLVSRNPSGRKVLDDLMFGRRGTWLIEANTEAAHILQTWVRRGYFTKDFSGVSYEDSYRAFLAGKSATILTGTWLLADFMKAEFEVGFFPFPPYKEGGSMPMQVGGVGVPLGINRATKHPDLAAKFIDYGTASPAAARPRIAIGALPAMTPLRAPAGAPQVLRDVLNTWNLATRENKIGWYLDFATPTFYDTLTAALQELLALRLTPEAFVRRLEADYAKFLERRK